MSKPWTGTVTSYRNGSHFFIGGHDKKPTRREQLVKWLRRWWCRVRHRGTWRSMMRGFEQVGVEPTREFQMYVCTRCHLDHTVYRRRA